MKISWFLFIIIFAALSIAGTAAFFSVTGIASLFKGHFLSVSIMASVLEFGKLVVASFIYRYWNDINIIFKYYLTISLVVLMIITSAGIFGYLSESYQSTKNNYTVVENQISVFDSKKGNFLDKKNRLFNDKNSELLTLKSNRIRLDSLTSKGINITRTRQDIKESENKISLLENNITVVEDSINYYNNKILLLKNSNTNGELGPLKYISTAFNSDMDDVVKFFIFLLIFVFDPLAVSLVISANFVYSKSVGYKTEFTDILFDKTKKTHKKNDEITKEQIQHARDIYYSENNNKTNENNIEINTENDTENDKQQIIGKNVKQSNVTPWHSANWHSNKK